MKPYCEQPDLRESFLDHLRREERLDGSVFRRTDVGARGTVVMLSDASGEAHRLLYITYSNDGKPWWNFRPSIARRIEHGRRMWLLILLAQPVGRGFLIRGEEAQELIRSGEWPVPNGDCKVYNERIIPAGREFLTFADGVSRILDDPALAPRYVVRSKVASGAPVFMATHTLENSDLSQSDLAQADLSATSLEGAFMCGARLIQADLRGSNLRGAWLDHANLTGADLRGADLRDARFQGANLSAVCMDRRTRFNGAEFNDATILPVDFNPALRGAVRAE